MGKKNSGKEADMPVITDQIRQAVAVDIWFDSIEHVRMSREKAGLPSLGLSDDVKDEIDAEVSAVIAAKVNELTGMFALKQTIDNAGSVNRA